METDRQSVFNKPTAGLSRWRRPMDRRLERGEATRRHLLETATRLFAERGYDHTPIELVLAEAGVSRGALYHHFPSKVALFDACLDAVQARPRP
jgi:AcrR family transcriptional regulator